jgi:NADH:ubiquinone oxidoreductase subunit
MGILSEIFIWWGGNTWGTRWDVWRHGRHVGDDAEGNAYYEQRKGTGPLGVPRRWVVYKSYAEATKVPPEWHGWLHHTVDQPPTETDYKARTWQKPHRENLTGTSGAYRPQGSILGTGKRVASTSDYQSWKPD